MSRPKPAASRTGHAAMTPTIVRSAVATSTPAPPDTLGDWGRDLWEIVWDLGAGVYQPTDYWCLERWTSLQERRRDLCALIRAEGLMTVGSTGQPVAHPALKLVDAIEGRLPGLDASLGLTPESRLRLGLQAVEQQSRLSRFLSDGSDSTA
jgi:P27 family predicted phage terminase small subunit